MDDKAVTSLVKSIIKASDSKKINLDIARFLIQKVEAKASGMGVKAVVAIADIGANIIAVEVMDDAYIASYDIAVKKAYTSVALKMPTSDLKSLAAPGGSLYGIECTNEGKIVIFGGGVPLKLGDTVIGGLGVSGGSEEDDTFLAEYGGEVFRELF